MNNSENILKDNAIFGAPGEYDIRTGALNNVEQHKSSTYTGVISAPYDFFHKKYNILGCQDFDKFQMLVTYSIDKGSITFIENNTTDKGAAVITGKIELNPQLAKLGINTQKTYTSQQLADLLKFHRILFHDSDECMNIVTKLKNFVADVNTHIEDINDKQGTKSSAYAHKISHQLNLTFVLSAPVMTAGQSVKFKVEIMFDIRDKAIEFWLESVELKEIFDAEKNESIKSEIAQFNAAEIPTIELL